MNRAPGVMRAVTTTAARVSLIVLGLAAFVAPAAAVPNPTVTGPIPANAAPGDPSRDYPWMSTMHNLAAMGYVEEEFFFSGTANRYNTPGPLGTTGSVRDGGHPYQSRMIVRRPIHADWFNGTVIVEWQNVTAGYDLDAHWGGSFDHFLRSGYAWVGVSAQRVGVQGVPNGLKNWSPGRYGDLDVTAGGAITDDALSYDIFAQAAQAIRTPGPVDVMGGLPVRRVFAVGASQSASRLTIFINSLHPLIGDPIDAYMLNVGGGRIREDLSVPVFKLLSETDVPGQVASRQSDTAVFRTWEVAGSSHSGRRTAMNSRPLVIRDGVTPAPVACTFPPHPRVPNHHATNVAYDHMVGWVDEGVPPPTAPRVATVGTTIQRDEFGNALGGLRLAEFEVATAVNTGSNSGSGFCLLYGRYLPFDQATLAALYPSHGSYVSAVDAVTEATVQAGYVHAADAEATLTRAAQSIVGRGDPCGPTCRAAQTLLEQSYYYLFTAEGGDGLANRVRGAIADIARGDGQSGAKAAQSYAKARQALQQFVDRVTALEANGTVSPTSAGELVTAAAAIIAALEP